MKLLVTGAGGMIGTALCARAAELGWQVIRLRRGGVPSTGPSWDVAAGRIDLSGAGTIDAVVHLAGEPVAQRWSRSARRRILESRGSGTEALGRAIRQLSPLPRVVISASAIGYYGDRGDAWMDERAGLGTGFLAGVCQKWEEAIKRELGDVTRVVRLRIGIVLAREGGALARMWPVFRLGLGGKLGGGGQYWSWITLHDLVRVMEQGIGDDRLSGAVNAVAPHPVTNAEFTRTLGSVLHRPTVLGVPRLVVETVFGDMGREALLSSTRVRPARLLESGFQFNAPDLETALRRFV